MAGIYIHIPFCAKKCGYCDFYSVVNRKGPSDFMKNLQQEIYLRRNYLSDHPIKTIYFGGGTPSLLLPESINSILNGIIGEFDVDPAAEVTLEANPDDLTLEYLKGALSAGVNRISIGVQSFNDTDLQFLGRRHNAHRAIDSVKKAGSAGFKNISIDLIYALPSSGITGWEENLKIAFSLGVQHLSCYTLTYESGTPLFRGMKKGAVKPLADEDSARQFDLLREKSHRSGFIHYEVSNLCLPSFESKHNTAYWSGAHYLGLGPSAHSFNGPTRSWNPRSIKAWQKAIECGAPAVATEYLTETERQNELVMLSLRTINGLDLINFRNNFGDSVYETLLNRTSKFLKTGTVRILGDRLTINPAFWFVSDSIIVELIE